MADPILIDARDLLCPLPVLRLRKVLATIAPGAEVLLSATDPAAHVDVPHFCAEQGHTLLETSEADGATTFHIRRRA
ncbi:sulfurtransferase TusA family protein [Gymnodinialimonas hymeniacidonis]|uniref:sulfurtransferase TusA family protein n=1 Tax=Gymnodinialimonas hymeniacidonis TaxID=3126508 RepID=UPI0034C6599A